MHGLINRAFQSFVCDTYGEAIWETIVRKAALEVTTFEAMLVYDDQILFDMIRAASETLQKPCSVLLEDVGTYLVSHPTSGGLRRLLRFGGDTFGDFLLTLDDMPDWAQLALPELYIPPLEVRQTGPDGYRIVVNSPLAGIAFGILGVLRAMADDYGALVLMDLAKGETGLDQIEVQLLDVKFAKAREFDLAHSQ